MEATAAKNIFERSLNYKMRYTTFVSYGDSSEHLSVCGFNGCNGTYGRELK